MKMIRQPAPPGPKARPIMYFPQPAPMPYPKFTPQVPSNETAAETLRKAPSPGGIDPTQQKY